ncbi:DNA phosphorothioation-associated putative methyltransferase [Motiliproteus sediminis]|uniref:DNA phosphorothioation-associated putative methyltransferase n=1 Tax=Motiliproteus sediminis TaxID=1468178 RepID=UPI001AEF8B27|nr:DNA phosphorothioation-associated putative methyltransferase [Motiliproteus sediminis]
MDFDTYQSLIKNLKGGKQLPDATYLHTTLLEDIASELHEFVQRITQAVKIDPDSWNVLKCYKRDFRISLLHYPQFFDDAYPALARSTTIDLKSKTIRHNDYQNSDNPPILHRKELFIPASHPEHINFCAITEEGEAAGLYENARLIGFQKSWERLVEQHGYTLIDGRLFRSAALTPASDDPTVDRHKTAIPRQGLSAPMKALAKHGYLSGEHSVFDYGCGLGDDLRELEAHGIDATGWDPAHRPDADIFSADIVNLGFVINVIEDRDERIEALLRAYELADKVLVVSAMLASDSHIQKFQPYKDGVLTSRNTFQKYYAQSELQAFIEQTLEESAIAVGPGIFYVFRDKLQEQAFFARKQRRHHQWRQLSHRPTRSASKTQRLLEEHHELCESFWHTCLELGRLPATDEFDRAQFIIDTFGSPKRLFNALNKKENQSDFTSSVAARKEDMIIALALAHFSKRKPYTRLSDGFKRDIKALFSNYTEALTLGKEALYEVADTTLIQQACEEAHQQLPASFLSPDHSLTLHAKFLERLPRILRIYVGCATQLYGDVDEVDLIKIHIRSGKVSLMVYEGFNNSPLPLLKERIKIKMREQGVDFFDYVDEFRPQPLYNKSLLIDESFDDFNKQTSFDRQLRKRVLVEELIGPSADELTQALDNQNTEIKGYRFFSRAS